MLEKVGLYGTCRGGGGGVEHFPYGLARSQSM